MGDFDSNRFRSTNQEWETPDEIFVPLNKEFNFTLDVAASEANHKCPNYLTGEDNALVIPWGNNICWLNPPYRQVGKWVRKAYLESRNGATVVCLVQARTNTNWWHDYCMKGEVRFIRGRPKFKGCKHGLPQPLAIVIFSNNANPRIGNTYYVKENMEKHFSGAKIQRALNNLPDGTTIILPSVTIYYSKPIKVKPNQTIQGYEHTIIGCYCTSDGKLGFNPN